MELTVIQRQMVTLRITRFSLLPFTFQQPILSIILSSAVSGLDVARDARRRGRQQGRETKRNETKRNEKITGLYIYNIHVFVEQYHANLPYLLLAFLCVRVRARFRFQCPYSSIEVYIYTKYILFIYLSVYLIHKLYGRSAWQPPTTPWTLWRTR